MLKLKSLKKIELTKPEKKELFERVYKRVGFVPSPFYRFRFLSVYVKAGVFAMLIIFFSGATAYASMDALPGDLLYGIKINVVEKISGLAARSPEKRAAKETLKIEKRIREFEELAEKGKLTEKNTKILEKNVKANLKSFDQSVREIKQKSGETLGRSSTGEHTGKTQAETELEEKLEKHSERIIKLRAAENVPDKRALQEILERVDKEDAEIEDADEAGDENEEEYEDEDLDVINLDL